MAILVGSENKILLLREYTEKPTGMNKYNVFGARETALITFRNFIHHAVERFACVDGI